MKKTWIWILIIGLLLCVIAGLVIALIVLNGGSIPLAPFGAPAATPTAASTPAESAAPGTAAQGTGGGAEADRNGTAVEGEAANGEGSAAVPGGSAAGIPAGESGADPAEGAALPDYGGAIPPASGENTGSDLELPEGVSDALGILTDTAEGLGDGSYDPYDALGNMGDAVSAIGGDSPVDVSGATDALQGVISGVTDRNDNN